MSPSTFEGKNRTELSIFNTNANQDQELSFLSYCNNDFLGVYTVTPKILDIEIYYLCENINGNTTCPDNIDANIGGMVADASKIYEEIGVTLNQINTTISYFTVDFRIYPNGVIDGNQARAIISKAEEQGIGFTHAAPKITVFITRDMESNEQLPGSTHRNGFARPFYVFLNHRNENGTSGFGPTIAHEIGHAAFNLLHPSEHPMKCNGICDNENIMFWSTNSPVGECCGGRTRTNDFNRFFQWEVIHSNPLLYEQK